ncbi:MAG TPA: tRNA pseudouridine(38-40) synthase TruA [Acidimicrobiales bacterium]|nr:tRNA pseudouridine(38-40) synthase TruA [Acidimicrobiales bacterium]
MTLFDDPSPAASGPLVRVRLLVAYDGSGFHGFAAQPGVPTVGGTLAEAIEKVARVPVELTCAGRTDAGVHAWGQVVHVDLPAETDLERLHRSLLKLCGPRIVVRQAEVVADDFDARFSARSRTYRYRVLNAPVPDPFTAHLAWHVPTPLDLDLLALACDPFLGEHDFSAFCRRPKGEDGASLVRRVLRAGWTDLGDGHLRFEIEATAFCHQMVRSIVGTIVAAGGGSPRAGDIRAILGSGDRAEAAPIAPPHGLMLWHVAY